MNHFAFPQQFRAIYDKAVVLYGKGQRGPETFFGDEEVAFLKANGVQVQHVYDYAEDHTNYGEPGFEHALAIELVRRDYFLNVQNGRPSSATLDVTKMPAKTETVHGIAWLPRLLPKARAKLRGELPSTIMFGCGGDRSFFKEHNILPAEFLALVWRHEQDHPVIDWVGRRTAAR